ncbi:MAG: tetratricopeptide repeat protein [Acidobacteriaceae bacterium]
MPDAESVIQLLRSQQYPQALQQTKALLVARPHDCRLLSLRGLALKGMQQPVDAVEAFKHALQYCPDDLLALEGAAEIEYVRHQPDAEALLRRVVKLRPDDVTAHAMLASRYRASGNCKAALPHFDASSVMFASHPKFQEAYAFCLAGTGDYAQAAKNYEQLIETDSDESVRFNLAFVQWRLHDTKSALETLQPLLKGMPHEAELTLGARLAEEAGDTPQAVKLLRAAIVAKPKDIDNYLEFAQISFNHHSFQVGIDMINAGLTQLPKAAPLYLARGVLEEQLSQSEHAVADFEKAHRLEPQLSLAMDAIGIMESQQFKQTAALDFFRTQSRLHPKDGLLQYLYAEALSQDVASDSKTSQEAIEAARRSVAADPAYGPARDLLAILWLHANQPQKALEQAVAALKIRPDDDVALYHEIMARRSLGQTQQVAALVKKLTGMRSENAQKERASHRYVLREKPGS